MKQFLFFTFFTAIVALNSLYSQNNVSGKVLVYNTKQPVEFAIVSIPEQGLWATTNENGEFCIRSVRAGKFTLVINCLGYQKCNNTYENISGLPENHIFYIRQDNLQLTEVVVTAQKRKDEISTSYNIDRNALNHIQANGISDVISQLPGGQTSKLKSLTSEQRIALHSQSATELDNASFGTAIEVDGVRLSNSGDFSTVAGVDTRNVAISNIESVEVVTGLPSVEHGDLTAGLIKINTKKGKTPLEVGVVLKPFIKSYSLSKGFELGKKIGTLNASFEHSGSISDRTSPYTTYVRNSLSLTYRNIFQINNKPLEFTYGLTGNVGGYNSEADPDAFKDTYTKVNDNVLRTNFKINRLLKLPWITNIEVLGSVNYNDRKSETKSNFSSSSATASIHATEEGYNIATKYDDDPNANILFVPAGYWYYTQYRDDRPVNYGLEVKARWIKNLDKLVNNVLVGAEFNYSGNYGKGVSYKDMRYAPTYRSFRYDLQPFVKNLSVYAEDKLTFPIWGRDMQIQAGIRSDIVDIKGSEYGTVAGFSPRLNTQYNIFSSPKAIVNNLSVHASIGDAVKLPSSAILFPVPSYSDKLAFASGTLSDGSVFYAYYTQPDKLIYNPNLKWERNRKTEIGIDMKTSFASISLSAFYDRILDPYNSNNVYIPYEYKLTDISALNGVPILPANRVFSIDNKTGVVTVADRTGTYSSQELAYTVRRQFKNSSYFGNGSPVDKSGVEWTIDFNSIKALKTQIRIDGAYFQYKGIDQTIQASLPSTSNMSDGNPYKYIAYYVGSPSDYNGSESKKLTTNVVFTTHIPAVRMIFTLRLEACFIDYSQNLSEYNGGSRSFVIDDKNSYFPSTTKTDIYGGNVFVGTYPLYYTTIDDMDTKIPFAETFLWAKDNDKKLYNELAAMVKKTNYNYTFNEAGYSAYYSANINLTKEIGNNVSVSFLANNFFNNLTQITNKQTGNKMSVSQSGKIPQLNYGISLRIKL